MRIAELRIRFLSSPLKGEDLPCGVEDFTPQGRSGGEGRIHEDRRKSLEIWI